METFYVGLGKVTSYADIKKQFQQAYAQQQKAAKVIDTVYGHATDVLNALKAAGVPDPGASYGTYQSYHETQAYINNGATKWNNYSGIKYAGQKGAKKGPNGYAIFDTIQDWANAEKHELTKGSNPAGAASLEDFAHRLKLNKYYEDTEKNYTSGLKAARYVLKQIPASERAGTAPDGTTQAKQDLDIPGSKDYSKTDEIGDWWKGLATWKKVTGGLAAGLLFIAVLKK